ncbi:hypothetical protein C8Q70DRAFT_71030 [Cubamyces menziesii]|nr:hypothetical protein C8Q70DRAFT_71030 [Cubamyces menziesii]
MRGSLATDSNIHSPSHCTSPTYHRSHVDAIAPIAIRHCHLYPRCISSSRLFPPPLLPKADDSPLALTIAAFTPRFPTEPTYEPLEPRLIRANFRSTARRAGTERVRGAQAPECQQATPQELAILPSSNDPTSANPVAHQCPVVRRKAYKLAMASSGKRARLVLQSPGGRSRTPHHRTFVRCPPPTRGPSSDPRYRARWS